MAVTVHTLSEAVQQATRSTLFCVDGELPRGQPGMQVEGLGAVTFPMKRGAAKNLIERGRVAPYGKGTETLVDTTVRNSFELNPDQFQLGEAWNHAVTEAARHAAEQLGLPADQVETRLYKLLIYDKGGFFLPHRDSEKEDGMVASLVVVLPHPFDGGNLIVRHRSEKKTLKFEKAAKGESACYAAFYADCTHEVQPVRRGIRVCLAYNLILRPKHGKALAANKPPAADDALTHSIRMWFAKQPTQPLVFALEHHYTERGLSLNLLKGADRGLAELILPAAERAECLAHLAQVSRHLLQFADDGSFERRYYHDSRPRRALQIEETYEDDLTGSEWADVDGKKQPWGEIPFETHAIVSTTPLDEWKPTTEEYEGYTGNAGNTLDRWYHRSALVLWPREQHFDVVASTGVSASMPLFRSMVAKLKKTPKKRLEEARGDCVRFARAIITRWPRTWARRWESAASPPVPYEDFPDLLLSLKDRDSIAPFLEKLAEQDETLPLADFAVAACRAFGWNAFAPELKRLLTPPPPELNPWRRNERKEIPYRDMEWLSAFCLDPSNDPDRLALANELCATAVERFCQPFPEGYSGSRFRREPSISEKGLPLLLKALAVLGRDEDLSNVLRFVESAPNEFTLDDCQVPALKALVPWSRKRLGVVSPPLLSWLTSVRRKLESATAKRPTPPTDWARPSEVTCTCPHCVKLNTFLADPANEVGRIAAREDLRRHVIGSIQQHQCDVTHTLERKGSPHALVLTKTTGSFERATKRFDADRRLLAILDKVGADNP